MGLAPMLPEFLKKNDEPTISVKILVGLPNITSLHLDSQKEEGAAYDRMNFGGSVRELPLGITTLF
jgi:hypothetical protein